MVFPLEIRTQIECKHSDGTYRPARVVERRQLPDGQGEEWEYYVHYRKLNRRMDEWVSIARLNLETVIPPEPVPEGEKGKKRRLDDEHSEEEGEGHEDFDPQQLREHEEVTKVKNIEVIELGRYSIQTWYFTPLPDEFKDCRKLYLSGEAAY